MERSLRVIGAPPARPMAAQGSASVTARAFETLLAQIMTFRLKPFDLVSEKVMSETLGISRTPAREALARLARLGFIDIYPQRGSVVAPLRLADLRKSQFLREALEVGLVLRAVESADRAELVAQLRKEMAVQATLAAISDDRRFFRSDEMFHQHIAHFVGLPGIWADISAAKMHMDRFRYLTFPRLDSMAVVIAQHEAIVAALESGHAREAEEAMRSHLRRIFAAVDAVRERHPEFFEAQDRLSAKVASATT
jgi:DNA-binding GntR family transcriptional regulator